MNLPYLAARIYIAIEHMKTSTRKRSTFDKRLMQAQRRAGQDQGLRMRSCDRRALYIYIIPGTNDNVASVIK
jgi:hypothetical protein